MQLHKRFEYRISANNFRGNYSKEETIRGNTVPILCYEQYLLFYFIYVFSIK